MANDTYKPGAWNAICDVCGFKFKSTMLTQRWDGKMVCHKDWEPRHPLEFIKIPKEEIAPPWVRPDADTSGLLICDIFSSVGIAGKGIAGCAVAGRQSLTG